MATDINPPVESWGTLSMKPDPGEEINALWGDKIAANEGWLFNRMISNSVAIVHQFKTDAEYTTSPSEITSGVSNRVRGLAYLLPGGTVSYAVYGRIYPNQDGTLIGKVAVMGYGTSASYTSFTNGTYQWCVISLGLGTITADWYDVVGILGIGATGGGGGTVYYEVEALYKTL